MGVCTPNFPPSFLLHRRDRLPIFQQSKASREFSAKSDWQPLQTRHHPGPESQRKDGATWAGSQVQGGPSEPWGGGWGRTPRTTAQARWLPSCALRTPLPGNPPEGVCVAPSLPAAHHVLGTEGPPASNPELSRGAIPPRQGRQVSPYALHRLAQHPAADTLRLSAPHPLPVSTGGLCRCSG